MVDAPRQAGVLRRLPARFLLLFVLPALALCCGVRVLRAEPIAASAAPSAETSNDTRPQTGHRLLLADASDRARAAVPNDERVPIRQDARGSDSPVASDDVSRPPGRSLRTWLQELGDSVVRRNEPSVWLGFLVAAAGGLVLGRLAAAGLRRAARYWARNGETVRSAAVGSIAGPTSLLFLTAGLAIGAWLLTLDPAWRWLSDKILALLGTLTAVWLLFNLIGVVEVVMRRGPQLDSSALDRQWLPLAHKTLQAILAALALLFVLDVVFERDIGAWLAGLGIAGIAVSLAAQDSLKNLFGSMTIIFDRPFLVGERIACLGFDGIVEEIGFRSTKLRTLAGHLVTIPNANLVNGPVENISRRPAIRRVFEILVSRTATGEQLARALELVRAACDDPELSEQIRLDVNGRPQPPIVTISTISPDGFVLSLTYFYRPPDFVECNRHADRLLVRVVTDLRTEGIPIGVIRGSYDGRFDSAAGGSMNASSPR